MSDVTTPARPPASHPREIRFGAIAMTDLSLHSKWRKFSDDITPGMSSGVGEQLEWSVGPGETTVLGPRPSGDVVDLTHVRAMYRLTGRESTELLNKLCALDLHDGMFPDGAAGRTLVAGVATEVVRNDVDGMPSYLLVPSRSFGIYMYEVLLDAGKEFSQRVKPSG